MLLHIKHLIFCIACLLWQPALAQEKVVIHNALGEWPLSNDITPAQAQDKALQQAKAEALRRAGVPETILGSNVLFKSENADSLRQLFQSLTMVDVAGEISGYAINSAETKMTEQKNILYRVWIDATVVLYRDPKDPGFGLGIRGMHEQYNSPDKLTFEVQPWKDGYLTLFIVAGEEGTLLYPNKMEPQQMLAAQKSYSFPLSRGLEYEVSTEKKSEVNYLLLLFTKDEMPFLKAETLPNVLEFISAINPSRKSLKTYSFLVRK